MVVFYIYQFQPMSLTTEGEGRVRLWTNEEEISGFDKET